MRHYNSSVSAVRIVLLGPPGAGKGSLALLCEQRLGLAHLSTGEIFRQEIARRSVLGRRVQRYVAAGRLVPDALVVQVMASRLGAMKVRRGFVLDGFPRTQGQAAGLDQVLDRKRKPIDGAVYVTSPEALLVRRLCGRRVCSRCGANYHLRTMRPKHAGVCDHCGGSLMTRKDDQPATIRKRLALDHRTAKPLLTYYKNTGRLSTVDGRGHIETVFQRTLTLFRHRGWIDGRHDRTQVHARN
ncbi:MAG: nucleoside monophosphate kinase [Candidatus Omnitrophica bacterium]|nr:nucleoside monophosphate kinase [Candidatus Omnitrophota bacterium]